jgi:ketosteroid isomerase-like protein
MDLETKLIAEVLEVECLWVAAHRNLDLEILRDILSDDCRQIQSDGTVIGKEDLLNSFRSGFRRWEVAISDEYEVRLLGNVALLIGLWRGVGENNGEKFDYSARFLAVYQLEYGEWKLISDVSVPLEG